LVLLLNLNSLRSIFTPHVKIATPRNS